MKVMMTEEFCPPEEIQRMKCELWNLMVKEIDISSYTTCFNELMILCPGMVPAERKKVEAYIRGLSKNIKGEVTSFEPATLNKVVRMVHTLMEQKVKAIAEREADNKKRKWENFQGGSSCGGGNSNSNWNNKNYSNNRNYNSNHNNNQNQYRNTNRNHQNNQRQGNVRAMTNVGNQNTNEAGQNVKLNKCGMQHYGNCLIKCNKCKKIGHKARDCWSKVVATGANAQPIVTCYRCREKGHIKTNCPARNNPRRSGAHGQAYALRDGDQNLGPNVVTVSCMKVKKYVDRGSYLFTAQVVEKEPAERRLEDVPAICKFLDMFPEDLPGLPPPRQVELKIKLVPGAAPVARAPYRLAPLELKELAKQLQELSDKGFIRPSSSPWGALGVHVDPTNVEAIKSWTTPKSLTKVRQFLGLAGYYRRFIKGFSLIAKPLSKLTQKNKTYEWGKEKEEAFQLLKNKLCSTPILALSEGSEDFVVYYDASLKGYGDVLMQREKEGEGKALEGGSLVLIDHKDAEHLKPSGLLQQPEIPKWKWENVTMDFVTGLPRTPIGYDLIWVIVDRLTKSAHFFPKKKTDSIGKLAELYLKEIMCRHGVPMSVISNRDNFFTSSWDKHFPLVEFSYNNSYHASIKAALFEALYGRK
nr:hypothetical protein [Tanacetum cinerariifolium]